MGKTIFSIITGVSFAVITLILVGIYWLSSLLARVVSLILMPLRGLISLLKSS